MSLSHYKKPLVVTTSGGKDSSVCVALAERAGIPFEVMHNHTTVDAPETVYFVRAEFKRLEEKGINCTINFPYYKGERVTMWSLIPQKLVPPTRVMRYCCSILKERGGGGRFITTGVRWAESVKRKRNRGIYEASPADKSKRVILNTGETVTAVCGRYVTPTRARFVFKDALGDAPMNDDATNAGGYYKSKGRRHVLEEIYPHLPPELREIITPRLFVETIDGERVEYADSLWIPSGTDVFGPREDWYKEEPDSVQLEIFKTERGRVKERNGETVSWWLRSPLRSSSYSFVGVYTGGTVYYSGAGFSLAFAPGFDL